MISSATYTIDPISTSAMRPTSTNAVGYVGVGTANTRPN
jgi:hypothetical protein